MKKIIIVLIVVAIGVGILTVIKQDKREILNSTNQEVTQNNTENCEENTLPERAKDFVIGQKYGEFIYQGDNQEKVVKYERDCTVYGTIHFSGTVTVSGTYARSDVGSPSGSFSISKNDRRLFPEITYVLYDNYGLEKLFRYSADEAYGEIGTSTIKIRDLKYHYTISKGQYIDRPGNFREEYLGNLSTTLIEIISNENEMAPYGYFIKE